ncbi:MAG: phage portal protein [Pseudomonadota bacterium]
MRFFRSSEAKSTSQPLVALSHLGDPDWMPRDSRTLAREGFERNAIGYRCVRMIAEAAASVPMTLAAETPEDHPLKSLLQRPNPEQTGTELLEAFFGHLQMSGNAYLEAVSLDGRPREIYTLRPDRMRAMKGPRGWPSGWIYRVGGEERRLLRQADGWSPVLHFKLFHPTDDYYGHAPLSSAAKAVDVHNSTAAWAKALINNSARPSGALIYGRDGAQMTETQYARLKEELERVHSGPSNAGRPLLLEGGLEWRPMGLSPSEMDFINARHDAAREIALAFGVPPMLLGVPGDNTYSNYKEANLAFWRQTILPLVEKAARALSIWLGERFETPASLSLDLDKVPALSGERDALWTRLREADFLDEAEKRAMAGLPPRAESAAT